MTIEQLLAKSARMNDAVYKIKRYEESSLDYLGIKKTRRRENRPFRYGDQQKRV